MLAPDLARLRKQTDDARDALKQPEDLQKVYAHAYDKLVTGPMQKVIVGDWRRFFAAGTAGSRKGFSRQADGHGQPRFAGGAITFPHVNRR